MPTSFPRSFAARSWLLAAAAGLVCAEACQRRNEEDARVGVILAPLEDFRYATHPSVGLNAAELMELARDAVDRSVRFRHVPSRRTGEGQELVPRLSLRLVGVELRPGEIQVRARLALDAPLSEAEDVHVSVGSAIGRGEPASRERMTREAVGAALDAGIEQLGRTLLTRSKTTDVLVTELNGADAAQAAAALELLAARRSPAAFAPLVAILRTGERDDAIRALGSLVALDDPRATTAVIEAAEGRDLAFLCEALYALGSLGGADAEGYLYTVDSGHADPRAREAAREALALARRRVAPKATPTLEDRF